MFVGEMKDNCFNGLGKMIFKDQTVYSGSFTNNNFSSQRCVL